MQRAVKMPRKEFARGRTVRIRRHAHLGHHPPWNMGLSGDLAHSRYWRDAALTEEELDAPVSTQLSEMSTQTLPPTYLAMPVVAVSPSELSTTRPKSSIRCALLASMAALQRLAGLHSLPLDKLTTGGCCLLGGWVLEHHQLVDGRHYVSHHQTAASRG